MSMTDGRSLTGSSWLSGSGSGDSLEAIMSASGELTMRRKTVGWSDSTKPITSPGSGGSDTLTGQPTDCDLDSSDDNSSLGSSGSVILDHNNNNNNHHNKAGSNPGSPLQERHNNNNSKEVVGSPSARDQTQRLRQERREKVEAEFRAVQAAWAGEAEGVQSEDEVVEPHPFDEPDLPTNIIFKDTSQAKAHRRPTLTDNSQPAEATLASDAIPTAAAAGMSSIAAVAEVTPMPSSAAQSQSHSPVLSPRREGVVTVTEETAVAQSTAPKADALRIRAGTLHKLIERLLGDYVDLGTYSNVLFSPVGLLPVVFSLTPVVNDGTSQIHHSWARSYSRTDHSRRPMSCWICSSNGGTSRHRRPPTRRPPSSSSGAARPLSYRC
jgi:hypothetical protein